MTTFYTIGAILTVVLPLFTKFGKKPTWKRIMDKVKPTPETTPDTASWLSPELLKIALPLIEQLWRKPPPAPDEPSPLPNTEPSSFQDFIARMMLLLNVPTAPTTPVTTAPLAPIEHRDDIASLVDCANAVAASNPDYDITIVVNENGVEVKKVKRVKVEAIVK